VSSPGTVAPEPLQLQGCKATTQVCTFPPRSQCLPRCRVGFSRFFFRLRGPALAVASPRLENLRLPSATPLQIPAPICLISMVPAPPPPPTPLRSVVPACAQEVGASLQPVGLAEPPPSTHLLFQRLLVLVIEAPRSSVSCLVQVAAVFAIRSFAPTITAGYRPLLGTGVLSSAESRSSHERTLLS